MSTKFAKFTRLACIAIALVAILSTFPFSQAQIAHVSAASDPIVLAAVDVTSSSNCHTHHTRIQSASSTTTSAPCPPSTVMQIEQVPLSQALAHHWFYLPKSSATPQRIETMMRTQQQSLQSRTLHTSSTEAHGDVNPNYSCGWNASTSTDAVLNGDTVSVEIFFYLAADCSTIILKYSNTELSSAYYNPMYWQYSYYYFDLNNGNSYPYCWSHYCEWGEYNQTLAPPNTYYRGTYNATEQGGHNYVEEFWGCYDDHQHICYATWYINLGNIS